MPFLSKAGSILRQTANRQSIHNAIRCTSSVGSQESLRGNSYSTDQQSLRKVFPKSGDVDGKTFMDSPYGRSIGRGFITSSAIRPLEWQELHGCHARLNYATVRPGSNLGIGVGYGLRSYGIGASYKFLSTGNRSNHGPGADIRCAANSIIGSGNQFGVGQSRSLSSGATGNTRVAKSGVDSTGSKLARTAASYLPTLAVIPHISSEIKDIMADYVHQEVTREFILILFSLFFLIVSKDLLLFLVF